MWCRDTYVSWCYTIFFVSSVDGGSHRFHQVQYNSLAWFSWQLLQITEIFKKLLNLNLKESNIKSYCFYDWYLCMYLKHNNMSVISFILYIFLLFCLYFRDSSKASIKLIDLFCITHILLNTLPGILYV